MRRRTLGKTGFEVSELGMGGLFVAAHSAELEEGVRAVRRALELGVNYVDTAPSYGNSEEVLGQALEGVEQLDLLDRDHALVLIRHSEQAALNLEAVELP